MPYGRQMKTVTATGSFVSMFALSFLAVFREGLRPFLCRDYSADYNCEFLQLACYSRSHHHCSGHDQGWVKIQILTESFHSDVVDLRLGLKMLGVKASTPCS